tara:strand:- start:214 stop:693 length:480 start_codon:yes stop_codon:yes gene_type:complete
METLVFKQASEKKSTLKSFGTVTNVIGVNGKVVPTNSTRALEEQACNLKVELTKADGTFLEATCSRNVMKDLWAKTLAFSELKTLDVIETFADKSALNAETNLYEKVLDEAGNPVKEAILTLGYSGTDASALTLEITAEDVANAETAKRTVNWENLIAL